MEKHEFMQLLRTSNRDKLISFLGDSAGSIPFAGGAITTFKNLIFEQAKEQQLRKLLEFIFDLNSKIDNLEIIINQNTDDLLVNQVYIIANKIAFSTDPNEYNLYLNYLKNYLNNTLEENDKYWILDIVTKLSPVAWKILKQFYESRGTSYFYIREFLYGPFQGNEQKKGIDYGEIDPIFHQIILDFIRYGILEERHILYMDQNSSGYIEEVKISTIGEKIYQLIK